ncbi:unnamed protein product, partial [Prorocentrum cordatum]
MPTELWSETRRAATVPRLAGGKRTLGDKEEGHGEEEGENRAVVYMPGCAAGLLYSGPEQVPKRNTTEGRGPDLGFGDAVILLTGMDSGAPDGAGLPEPETLNQQLAGIDVSRAPCRDGARGPPGRAPRPLGQAARARAPPKRPAGRGLAPDRCRGHAAELRRSPP